MILKRNDTYPRAYGKEKANEKGLFKRAAVACIPTLLLLLCILTGFPGAAPAEAAGNLPRVVDGADLFSANEEQELEERIRELEDTVPFDLVVVTVDNTYGDSAREYADNFYEDNGYGKGDKESGALYLIDMDNREIYISTKGDAILFLTDSRIDAILDAAYGPVSRGDYSGSAFAFLGKTEGFVKSGIPDNQYIYDEETGKIIRYYSLSLWEIGGAVLLALLGGGIPCLVIWRKYSMKGSAYSYPYRDKGRLTLGRKEDTFVNRTVSSRRIPKPTNTSSSGGGRSTTHTSRNGSTHGGGGRKF